MALSDIDRVAEMAHAYLESQMKGYEALLPATGPGTHRPSAMELVEFVTKMTQMFPPQPWQRPDGTVVVASPYLLALGECENGRQVLRRIATLYEEM